MQGLQMTAAQVLVRADGDAGHHQMACDSAGWLLRKVDQDHFGHRAVNAHRRRRLPLPLVSWALGGLDPNF